MTLFQPASLPWYLMENMRAWGLWEPLTRTVCFCLACLGRINQQSVANGFQLAKKCENLPGNLKHHKQRRLWLVCGKT